MNSEIKYIIRLNKPVKKLNFSDLKKDIQDILNEGINKHYTSYKIKKNSGGFRVINAPSDKLKTIQRNLLDLIYPIVEHHFFIGINGFINKRSIITNAKDHGLAKHITFNQNIPSIISGVRIDIKNAFGSTTKWSIVNKLIKFLKLSDSDAKMLSEIATLNGSLPQGSPLSPLMLNLCLLEADLFIFRIIKKKYNSQYYKHFSYTRYADDINITSYDNYKLPFNSINIVTNVLKQFGYTVKRSKTRIMNIKHGIFINGINIVNLNKSKSINISKNRRLNIRAMIYNTSKVTNQLKLNEIKPKILGKISFIISLNIKSGIKLFEYAIEKKIFDEHTKINGCNLKQLQMCYGSVSLKCVEKEF